MTYYSRYRRQPLSDNAKAIIAAIVICLGWAFVSEMDYREQTITVCRQEA